MNELALEKLAVASSKRITLLEEVIESQDDIISGLVQAVCLLGKRTKPTVGCDAGDFVLYGPHSRIRPLPSGITHEDLSKQAEIEVFQRVETEEYRAKRLKLQTAILQLRSLRAARLAKQPEKEKLSRGAHGRGLQLKNQGLSL